MKVALDAVLILLLLVAVFWIALFGTTGAVMADRAQFTKLQGFFVGVLLGPAGLIWLLIRSRRGESRNGARTNASATPPSRAPQSAPGELDSGL